VKNFRSQHRPKKNTLIAGRKNVLDALNGGKSLDRIYFSTKAVGEELNQVRTAAARLGVPISYVPIEKLNSYNAGEHEGCIGLISRVHYQDLQQVISWVVDQGIPPLFLILDGITDIRNIGGIARTAFCTGVQAIIIPDKGVGALNEDAVLTSAGALEMIPICRVNSLLKAVDELHLNGIKVLASEMTAEQSLFDTELSVPVAIIMGSEEKGIYPALLKSCDEKFKIPMAGDFESLNVSVATGMILYETMKQRMTTL
jgi:23S rRNA (guanosine2251-2'-O)-methyltransferase